MDVHPAFKQLAEGCEHLGLDAEVAKELISYLIAKRAMHSGDASCQAIALSMSPSVDMDELWHWMLLNTHVRDEVHKLVGGDAPHTTATAADPEPVKQHRRNTAQSVMRSFGFSPRAVVWSPSPHTTGTNDVNNMPPLYHRKRKLSQKSQACDDEGSHAALRTAGEMPNQKEISVIVRLVTGETFLFRVTNSTTVTELQQMIEDRTSIPVRDQKVYYNGDRTFPERPLQYYTHNTDGVTFDCVMEQRGC